MATLPGQAKVNRFLREENVIEVRGTWAKVALSELEERVRDGGNDNHEKKNKVEVKGLVFCYPRQVGLVKEYLMNSEGVEVIIWIGPRCDEDSFGGVLETWGEKEEEVEGGLVVEDGEAVAVYSRR